MDGLGFYIGNFFIAYYGACIAAGIFAAAAAGWYQVKRHGENFYDLVLIAAVGGLCGIVGAKLLYLLVSIEQIDFSRILDLEYLNSIMTGGFVFYGGLLGGLSGLFLCRKLLGVDVGGYLSIGIPCLPIVHGFGRIGCSLVGCCYGIPYQGPGAVFYENSLFAPNQQWLFPVQGMEAVLDFGIACILLIYINCFKGKLGVAWYLILYAAARFGLEFLRYDNQERGILAGLSTSQYISLAIIAGVAWYRHVRRTRVHKKTS